VRLVAVVALAVCVNVVGAAIAIADGLPAEWGHGLPSALAVEGDPDDVLGDFFGFRGTAIAPPLVMIVALAVLGLLSLRTRLAAVGIALLGAAGLVGYLGEPYVRELLTSGGFDGARSLLVFASVALYGAMTVLALRRLQPAHSTLVVAR
jgi:hypothetical protein